MTKPKPKPPPPPVLHPTPAGPGVLARFQADCRAAAIPDTTTPFRSIEDAVDRLLPYHVLATEEGDDADVDETHDGEGGNLLCSRRDAWQSMCLMKTTELFGKVKRMTERVEALEARVAAEGLPPPEVKSNGGAEAEADKKADAAPVGSKRAEEEYYLHLLCGQEAKRWKEAKEEAAKQEEQGGAAPADGAAVKAEGGGDCKPATLQPVEVKAEEGPGKLPLQEEEPDEDEDDDNDEDEDDDDEESEEEG